MEPKFLIGINKVDNKLPGIYMIYCLISGKAYIGQSTNFYKRLKEHKRLLRHDKHPNKHLQYSWTLYSENAFSFIPLENCSKELLTERENYYIDLINEWKLNLLKAGGTREYSIEYREKQSKRQKGIPKTEEFKSILKEAHKHCKCHTPEGIAIRSATMKNTLASKPKTVNLFNAKLNMAQVKEIKILLSEGKSAIEIGKLFNTPRQTITSIRRGDSWKNV
jgi:group I intron endonuclease